MERNETMTSPDDRLVQITNYLGSSITVITVATEANPTVISSQGSSTFQLQSQGVVLRWNGPELEVVLIGTQQSDAPQSSGMCLCIIPGTRVVIQVEQSMNITIRGGMLRTGGGTMVDAVGCGDDTT
jgi:hypothetical protein